MFEAAGQWVRDGGGGESETVGQGVQNGGEERVRQQGRECKMEGEESETTGQGVQNGV